MYRNTRYMCILRVANIIGAPATQYVRLFLWISPLSIIVADVSSQFSTLQLRNIIVLAARFLGTLFGRQIVQCTKSGQGELAGR